MKYFQVLYIIIIFFTINGCLKKDKSIDLAKGKSNQTSKTIDQKMVKLVAYLVHAINYNALNNGILESRQYWKNHKEDGKHTDWYFNGIKKQETNWKKGKLHGRYIKWNKKGELINTSLYKLGVKQKEETLDPKTGKMVVTFEKKIE